jgi:tetratricopeptide (TPR) repeat protein
MTADLGFSVDTQQDYRAGGRVEWAADLARQGAAAMKQGEYAAAVKHFLDSVNSYPHPTTLRRLGICLMLDRRPADAVLYFAAAAGLSKSGRRTRPSLLLAKALLVAGNGSRCARLIKSEAWYFPEVMRRGIAESLRDGWRQVNLHRMLDELLGLIPEQHDTADAKDDPSVHYTRLKSIYSSSDKERIP